MGTEPPRIRIKDFASLQKLEKPRPIAIAPAPPPQQIQQIQLPQQSSRPILLCPASNGTNPNLFFALVPNGQRLPGAQTRALGPRLVPHTFTRAPSVAGLQTTTILRPLFPHQGQSDVRLVRAVRAARPFKSIKFTPTAKPPLITKTPVYSCSFQYGHLVKNCSVVLEDFRTKKKKKPSRIVLGGPNTTRLLIPTKTVALKKPSPQPPQKIEPPVAFPPAPPELRRPTTNPHHLFRSIMCTRCKVMTHPKNYWTNSFTDESLCFNCLKCTGEDKRFNRTLSQYVQAVTKTVTDLCSDDEDLEIFLQTPKTLNGPF